MSGTNGYDVEFGFQPLDFLGDKTGTNRKTQWLDLCCDTGKSSIQAATITDRDWLRIEIVVEEL